MLQFLTHTMKNLILISLHLLIIYTHAWGEKFNNENIKPLQIGIIQHNYINLTPYNQHYKYYAFIGITMTYNEWIDFNIIPIHFYPHVPTLFSNVYFTLSISLYILKYQIHIYSFIINILIGTQLPIALRTSIITGNNISAFLFPAFPFVSVKLNIPITNLFSILSTFSSSLREYFLVDIAITFPI
ncbi:hypothetical protein bt91E135_001381 (plasmid) [Borrelia turicatae 91E135]|uniref:Uncharacterized protein n=2 Tax=Borrelia turicatae TaxID=142 RepID=A0ABF7PUJ9_BORT9|nr:hypothetical protein BT0001 [Borrelia turicatae 91E135]UPA12888.1 hypothetical protein bt91E135_000001 [Borrelia turicatae 91E135]UPA13664.1 hypothetical protein bt91E135_000864 [Borrelia turicatae 91E135]UPA13927.1 hypothetical protein bt91E135_001086 [Borrelia turicatae 91E135]UPA14065.1 hypothetical protein bt91E135_001231 [Borrelia turicatae 91E135]